MYEQSHRDYLRSGYLHHRHRAQWRKHLIITVITPLLMTQNAREGYGWPDAAITDMQMRQRDVAALDAKYTKVMLKLQMMLCVMMLPLVVVGCTSKRLQSVSA